MSPRTWRLFLVVVGVLVTLVHCDLGLDVTVPNLKREVVASIGDGTVPLVKANGTIRGEAAQDTTGVIVGLVGVIGKIVTPLNMFLGQMLATASSGESAGRSGFTDLNDLAERSKLSLDEATFIAADLAPLIQPSMNVKLMENVQTIGENLDIARSQLQVLGAAVDQVRNSVDPVTSDNVTMIITKEAVNGLTATIKSITTSIKSLADVSNTIVRNINTGLAVQTTVSNSHAATSRNIDLFFLAAFYRSYDDVITNIQNLAKAYVANIRQAYGPVLVQRQPIPEENVATLNSFLDGVDLSVTGFADRSTESLTLFKEEVAQILNDQRAIIGETLSAATKTMTQDAFKSDNAMAVRCVQASTNAMVLTPPVNRLVNCIQGEPGSALPLVQLVRGLLDQSKISANSNANLMRTCQRIGTTCSNSVRFTINSYCWNLLLKLLLSFLSSTVLLGVR